MSNRFAAVVTLNEHNSPPYFRNLSLIEKSSPLDQSEFAAFLQELTQLSREKLFSDLAPKVEEHADWWATVLAFFPEPGHVASSDMQAHYQTLAYTLLRCAKLSDKKTVNRLSLLLPKAQLVELVNELKPQKNQIYEHLLLALTIRAMRNPAEYQCLVFGHPDLANELMAKRLQQQPDQHKSLIEEILNQPEQYNWQDLHFLDYVIDCVTHLFMDLNPEALKPLFKKYFTARRNHRHEICRILDAIVKHNNDFQIISDCIAENDDKQSQSFCYYYLVTSEVKHQGLLQHLLEQLSLDNLVKIGPHIVATRQIREPGQHNFTVIYSTVLYKKISTNRQPGPLLKELAENFACLNNNKEAIATLFNAFNPKIDLQHAWLLALIKTDMDQSLLFDDIYQLLQQPLSKAKKMDLLDALSPEAFTQFYVHLLTQQKNESDFFIIYQFIKEKKPDTKILFLFTETPQIRFTIDNTLFKDATLLNLLENLSKKALTDSSFDKTLEQLSLIFCHRLHDASNSLHTLTPLNQLPELAHYLLTNPLCFKALCERSSFFKSAVTDLEPRIVRLLNEVSLDEAQMQTIALRFLAHYQKQPAALHTVFTNLYAVVSALNPQGQTQFIALQRNCWDILCPKTAFNSSDCKTLLTTKLNTEQRFDPLLARLACVHAQDSKLGAQYLSQTPTEQLNTIDESSLVSILLFSTDPDTQLNWQKITETIDRRGKENNLRFIKKLLATMLGSANNPQLNQQVWRFLICLKAFNDCVTELSEDELIWLIHHCEDKNLAIYFPTWVSKLVEANRFPSLNMATLCYALPHEDELLACVYEEDVFTDFLNDLFIELAQKPSHAAHLLALQNRLHKQSDREKRLFITLVQQQLPAKTLNSDSLALLMMLFFSIQGLQSDNHLDVKLVFAQLNFLSAADNPSERLQVLINLFNQLNSQDSRWANVILSSTGFAQLIPHLLPEDRTNIRYHPFSQLLRQHAGCTLDMQLGTNNNWQDYLQSLLANPPENLSDDEFALLFAKLSPTRQHQLALQRLGASILDHESKPVLCVLANALSIDELYTQAERSKSPCLFIELITQHRQGLYALSLPQRNNLMQQLTCQGQLWVLLSNQSSFKAKTLLVCALFDYLEDSKTPLESWLNLVQINGKVLAEFANHCINNNHQQLLMQAIRNRKELLQHYLNHPLPQQHLIKEGLLYHYVRSALIDADTEWQCSSMFFQQLTVRDQDQALKNQFNLICSVHHLGCFFSPFENSMVNIEQLYSGARWLQLLPILASRVDQKSDDGQLFTSRQQLLTQASTDKELFCTTVLNDKALTLSSHQLLNDLFSSHANYDEGFDGQLPKLSLKLKEQLADCVALHQNALENKGYSFSNELLKLLNNVTHILGTQHNAQCATWFIDAVLLSPLGHYIEVTSLAHFLKEIPLNVFSQALKASYQRQIEIDAAYLAFKPLNLSHHATDMVYTLQQLPRKKLLEFQKSIRFAQLPYLTALLKIAVHTKQNKLDYPQIAKILHANHYGQQSAAKWIHQEIKQLEHLTDTHAERCLQLASLALSYQDDKNNWQRLDILTHDFFLSKQPKFMAGCLNSYASFFSQQPHLKAIYPLIALIVKTPDLVAQLSKPFYLSMLLHLLNDIEAQKDNIAQFIRLRTDKKLLKAHLKSVLHKTLPASDQAPPQSMMDLIPENLIHLSPEQLNQLLMCQSFCFYTEPVEELQSWQRERLTELEIRSIFCQEASMYAMCCKLARDTSIANPDDEQYQIVKVRIEQCLEFIQTNSNKWEYLNLLDQFNERDQQQYPQVNYHRLTWLAFLAKTPELLLQGFLEWLDAPNSESNDTFLNLMLDYLLHNDLLDDLCLYLQQHPLKQPGKSEWLCDRIIQSEFVTPTLITKLVPVCSWPWLLNQLRKGSSYYRSHFLSAAFQCEPHRHALFTNQKSLSFLQLLMDCSLPVNELINIIQKTAHPHIKNVLAIHLLCRPDYINQLPCNSFLDKPGKKRLQPLLNCIDLEQTPIEEFSSLHPEAAASLFCSLRHLHQLDEEKLLLLLQRFDFDKENTILYWLSHYADKPNAEIPLAILAKNCHPVLMKCLAKCEEAVIRKVNYSLLKILPQLPEFKPTELKFYGEEQLVSAIQLFLFSSQDKSKWIDFIKRSIDKLSQKKEAHSKELLHFLIRINETSEFADYQPLQTLLGSNLLQNDKFLNDCSLFYDDGQFQINRALKKLNHYEIKKEDGIVQKVYSLVKHLPNVNVTSYLEWFAAQINQTQLLGYLRKNSVLQTIAGKFSKIPCFNYFLIHYSGSRDKLDACLHDYLSYFLQDNPSDAHFTLLQSTAWLINQAEVTLQTRNVLYEAFLKFPGLINAEIGKQLLLFSAQKTLESLGHLDYPLFIDLCSRCEPLLTDSPHVLQFVKKAKAEAVFEQSLSQMTGWLLSFRLQFHRCWFYGWDGWFTPKKPEYVKVCYQARSSTQQTLARLSSKVVYSYDLPSLLRQLTPETLLTEYETLLSALKRYNLLTIEEDSPLIRQKVDEYYQILISQSNTNQPLAAWLQRNQDDFLHNRCLLAGIYWKTGDHQVSTKLCKDNSFVMRTLKEYTEDSEIDYVTERIPESSSLISDVRQKANNLLSTTLTAFWKLRPSLTNTVIGENISAWFGSSPS